MKRTNRTRRPRRVAGIAFFSAVFLTAWFVLPASAPAGDINPPADVGQAGSAMYTLDDLYNRLDTGAAGVKSNIFDEPTAGPQSTGDGPMRTLDEIMGKAPAVNAGGAVQGEVCDGKGFWGLTSGAWGVQTGTLECPVQDDTNGAGTGEVCNSKTFYGLTSTEWGAQTGTLECPVWDDTSGAVPDDVCSGKTFYGLKTGNRGAQTGSRSCNVAPTVANAIPNQSATEDSPFDYQFPANAFDDADGDSLTYSALQADGTSLPGWLTFDGVQRRFTGTPANGDVGTVAVLVTADDGNGHSITDTFVITVTNTNDPPQIASPAVRTVNTGATVVLNALAHVSDPDGDPVQLTTVTCGGDCATGSCPVVDDNNTGGDATDDTILYTAPGSAGSCTVSFTVSDGTATATGSFSITVQ